MTRVDRIVRCGAGTGDPLQWASMYVPVVTVGASRKTGTNQTFALIRRTSTEHPGRRAAPAAPRSRKDRGTATAAGHAKPSAATGTPGISCTSTTAPST